MFARQHETALEQIGYYRDAFGTFQDFIRNPLVGRVHDLIQNLRGRFQALGNIRLGLIGV